MNFTISRQVLFFLWSVIMGLALGGFWDIGRCIAEKKRGLLRFLADIIFCITATLSLFALMLLCGGELREYMVIGAALGGLLYFISLSDYFVALLSLIIKVIAVPFRLTKKIYDFFVNRPRKNR